jgi:hypothetical protein
MSLAKVSRLYRLFCQYAAWQRGEDAHLQLFDDGSGRIFPSVELGGEIEFNDLEQGIGKLEVLLATPPPCPYCGGPLEHVYACSACDKELPKSFRWPTPVPKPPGDPSVLARAIRETGGYH